MGANCCAASDGDGAPDPAHKRPEKRGPREGRTSGRASLDEALTGTGFAAPGDDDAAAADRAQHSMQNNLRRGEKKRAQRYAVGGDGPAASEGVAAAAAAAHGGGPLAALAELQPEPSASASQAPVAPQPLAVVAAPVPARTAPRRSSLVATADGPAAPLPPSQHGAAAPTEEAAATPPSTGLRNVKPVNGAVAAPTAAVVSSPPTEATPRRPSHGNLFAAFAETESSAASSPPDGDLRLDDIAVVDAFNLAFEDDTSGGSPAPPRGPTDRKGDAQDNEGGHEGGGAPNRLAALIGGGSANASQPPTTDANAKPTAAPSPKQQPLDMFTAFAETVPAPAATTTRSATAAEESAPAPTPAVTAGPVVTLSMRPPSDSSDDDDGSDDDGERAQKAEDVARRLAPTVPDPLATVAGVGAAAAAPPPQKLSALRTATERPVLRPGDEEDVLARAWFQAQGVDPPRVCWSQSRDTIAIEVEPANADAGWLLRDDQRTIEFNCDDGGLAVRAVLPLAGPVRNVQFRLCPPTGPKPALLLITADKVAPKRADSDADSSDEEEGAGAGAGGQSSWWAQLLHCSRITYASLDWVQLQGAPTDAELPTYQGIDAEGFAEDAGDAFSDADD